MGSERWSVYNTDLAQIHIVGRGMAGGDQEVGVARVFRAKPAVSLPIAGETDLHVVA